jgi:hypothetical protein
VNPITINNISEFRSSENNQDNLMSLNKDYDNVSSQYILKPRVISINTEGRIDKKSDIPNHCLYSELSEEVISIINLYIYYRQDRL